MGVCWSSAADNQSLSTTGHLSSGISQTTSNTTSSGGSTTSGNSRFSAASGSEDSYPNGQILPHPNLRIFSFSELRTATRNFRGDTVLGEGGFGKVYKGWLDEKSSSRGGSGSVIAVKKLNSESMQGFEEWQSEVNFLGRLSHPNLVKLLGYCWEEKELLLVYEFMQKGSLENHLFGRGSTVQPLPWNIRLRILIGAARGLAFLHSSERQVIYRDFKASNILLDGSYNARISDFGLAKIGPTASQSHVTTRVMGTYGYAAPEYVATGHLYVKSDVYGFGVVLVEMLTGLRALDTNRPNGQHNLVDWIKPHLSDRRKLKNIMDMRLEGKYPSKSAVQIAQLALTCLGPEPKTRPSMKEVVDTLERVESANERPKEPRMNSTRHTNHHRYNHHYHQQQQQQQQHQHQQMHGGDFARGPQPPPGPPQMMRQPSASSTTLNALPPPDYHPHPSSAQPPILHPHPPFDTHADNFAAKRMRKVGQRRAVDYTSTVVRYIQIRMWQRDSRDRTVLQPTPAAAVDMLPTAAYLDNPSTSFAAKFVHTSLNKNRCSINRVLWTPNGRRLITGSQSGEFTLWNGQSFNFEMILQAHDQAVRSMVWSHNDLWMVAGDDGGTIKYWQTNMNNVKVNKSAHKESVRDLSFCRTDLKFCSCSDDTTVKVWDFARCQEDCSLSGHGWDVKSVDWHPTKSLLASGGKDNLVKLWDAKSGRELCSFHGHKNTVLSVKWNQNGNWVLTASKDQIIKLYDIRAMKELESFRGHRKDVTALAWHPFHEEYFVSGSFDGSIFHWLIGHETPQVEIFNAHDNSVWDLAWHPIGYILCSGSNDHTTKFWCRNRPGDSTREKFNTGFSEQNTSLGGRMPSNFPGTEAPTTPGPFAAGMMRNDGTIPGIGVAMPLSIPSLDSSAQGDQKPSMSVSMPLGAPPLPPGPHPSLLAGNQQQSYQQNTQHVQQHHSLPQQISSLPLPPPNMTQLQPSGHQPLLTHPHLPRPPSQLQPLNMPSNIPSSVQGSLSIQSMSMPGMVMQGNINQMGPPMPQGHFMGRNPMPSGSGPPGNVPPGGIPNGLMNMQAPSNVGGSQMFPPAGAFNRPQTGQMQMMQGINLYQAGNPNAPNMGNLPPNFGPQSGMPPPLPPGPPPHGQTHQQ